MKDTTKNLLPYLDHLRALPFITEAEVVGNEQGAPAAQRVEAELHLRTPAADHRFLVEVKRTHLTRAIVDGVLARMEGLQERPWILFAPYVGRPLGEYRIEYDVNFVDRIGSCRLQIGREYLAVIQGRRRTPETRSRGLGLAGYRVLFALLARDDLLNVAVRTLVGAAEVSKKAGQQEQGAG